MPSSMAHPRTLIRLAVVAQLVAANTAAGARVYDSRVGPARAGDLPAIVVYTLTEPIDGDSGQTAPRELTRTIEVEIAGFVRGADEAAVAVAMDDLALQIEDAMDADPWIGDTAADSVLDSTVMEIGAENGRSDPLVGTVVLTYAVTYRTRQGETAVADFVTVNAKRAREDDDGNTVPMVDVADTPIPEDTFTVQEPPP